MEGLGSGKREREALTGAEEEALGTGAYFHGRLWRSKAEELVAAARPGSFLLRELFNWTGQGLFTELVLSVRGEASVETDFQSRVFHHRLLVDHRGFFSTDAELYFESLQSLVAHYHQTRVKVSLEAYSGFLDFPIGRQPWELFPEDLNIREEVTTSPYGSLYTGFILRSLRENQRVPFKVAIRHSPGLDGDQRRYRAFFLNDVSRFLSLSPHPNIVNLYGCCLHTEPILSVKEMSELGTLRTFLLKQKDAIAAQRSHLAYQVSAAVSFLSVNCNLVHLDITSHNFYVFPQMAGSGYRLKLANMFHAQTGPSVAVRERVRAGLEPRWSAPEVMDGAGRARAASDVWSAAMVVWELWAGGLEPWEPEPLELGLERAEVVKGISEAVRAGRRPSLELEGLSRRLKGILADAWSTRPARRPTPKAFHHTLSDIARHHLLRKL